eukprot:5572221-Amphidinium_carterae.3
MAIIIACSKIARVLNPFSAFFCALCAFSHWGLVRSGAAQAYRLNPKLAAFSVFRQFVIAARGSEVFRWAPLSTHSLKAGTFNGPILWFELVGDKASSCHSTA